MRQVVGYGLASVIEWVGIAVFFLGLLGACFTFVGAENGARDGLIVAGVAVFIFGASQGLSRWLKGQR